MSDILVQLSVVLLRPKAFEDELYDPHCAPTPYGVDTYIARLEVTHGVNMYKRAIEQAQAEVFTADCRDFGKRKLSKAGVKPESYTMCLILEGHPTVGLYGWQIS